MDKELSIHLMADVKVCSSCKETHPLSSFNKNKSQPSGYANQCKNCKKKSNLKHADKHRETRKLSNKNWYQSNKSYSHKLTEEWYKKNPEVRRERQMRRYAAKIQSIPKWADKE